MKKLLFVFAILLVFGVLAAAAGVVGLYFWAAEDLPGFRKITDYRPPLVTTVYARDNQILGYLYSENASWSP